MPRTIPTHLGHAGVQREVIETRTMLIPLSVEDHPLNVLPKQTRARVEEVFVTEKIGDPHTGAPQLGQRLLRITLHVRRFTNKGVPTHSGSTNFEIGNLRAYLNDDGTLNDAELAANNAKGLWWAEYRRPEAIRVFTPETLVNLMFLADVARRSFLEHDWATEEIEPQGSRVTSNQR